jgi:AraC-like DNA-binding protein
MISQELAAMTPLRLKTIAEFHRFRHLPPPDHPLISVFQLGTINRQNWDAAGSDSLVFDFYSIALKRDFPAKARYGQQRYDFDAGVMSFMAPGQVFGREPVPYTEFHPSGWLLLVHPDFLWNTPLAKTIKTYEFFGYAVHEALFLSEKEEAIVTAGLAEIERECRANLDRYTQEIVVAQLGLLLQYCQRFYHRQFLTRKVTTHRILDRLERWLTDYFESDNVARYGLPSVQAAARELNLSPHYLSDLLKTLTGQATQQHIHQRLMERAKQELSTTDLTVSEVAFRLGFEHSQSFSKFFRKKTNLSPVDFRKSFSP